MEEFTIFMNDNSLRFLFHKQNFNSFLFCCMHTRVMIHDSKKMWLDYQDSTLDYFTAIDTLKQIQLMRFTSNRLTEFMRFIGKSIMVNLDGILEIQHIESALRSKYILNYWRVSAHCMGLILIISLSSETAFLEDTSLVCWIFLSS